MAEEQTKGEEQSRAEEKRGGKAADKENAPKPEEKKLELIETDNPAEEVISVELMVMVEPMVAVAAYIFAHL